MRAVEGPGNRATFRGMAGTRFGGRLTYLGVNYIISGNTLNIIGLDSGTTHCTVTYEGTSHYQLPLPHVLSSIKFISHPTDASLP